MQPLSDKDPRTAGEYTLKARLGAGGMGRVYLGYSPAGRAVAVKVVHPELARDEEFLARFRNEVAAAKAVSGLYTAPVVAAGLDDDPPWLATVFVPGPALDDVVSKHGAFPETILWKLAAGLSEALVAVHSSGLVHRDLKPSNVLLAVDGPKVIDFGISRAMGGTHLTATGIVVGTPGYMSPEQAEGNEAGAPSDVFSLACVVAYAATGRQPFGTGSAASVLFKVVAGQPDLEGVPPRLRQVLEECLRKDPNQRPPLPQVAAAFTRGASEMAAVGEGDSLTSFWPPDIEAVIRATTERNRQVTGTPLPAGPASPALGTPASPGPFAPGQLGVGQPGFGQVPQSPVPGAVPAAQGFTPLPSGGFAPSAYQPPAYQQPGFPPQAPAPSGPVPAWARPGTPVPGVTPVPGMPYPGTGVGMPGYRRPRRRPTRAELPSVVNWALATMYVGAAVNVVYLILSIVAAVHLTTVSDNTDGIYSASQAAAADTALGIIALFSLFASIPAIVMWLVCAGGVRSGRQWGAVTGTVFFGLNALTMIAVLFGANGAPGVRVMSVVVFGIGALATILVWHPQARALYRAFR